MVLRTMAALVSVGLLIAACGSPDESSEESVETDDMDLAIGKACGGFAGLGCPSGLVCIDNPNDSCNPKLGGADCIGMCVKKKHKKPPIACGGFAGLQCPVGLVCIDNPNDSCNPKAGGADCGGICIAKN